MKILFILNPALSELVALEASGDCGVEVSTVARVDCLRVFVRVRFTGVEGEGSRLEGQ